MDEIQKMRFKITVVGDSQVGKTSLIKRFTQGTFEQDYVKTLGAQFSKYDMEIGGNPIRLMFWLIDAEDNFLFQRPNFYRNSSAAIIVFSLEDTMLGIESFNHIPYWHKEVVKSCGEIPIFIFANKVDLVDEDELDEASMRRLVEENNFHGYYYTSVEAEQTVMKSFQDISNELYKKYKKQKKSEDLKKI